MVKVMPSGRTRAERPSWLLAAGSACFTAAVLLTVLLFFLVLMGAMRLSNALLPGAGIVVLLIVGALLGARSSSRDDARLAHSRERRGF